MKYINTCASVADLAGALLTEAGVTIPAHLSDETRPRWIREARINIESIGSRISENRRRHIEAMAMRDPCEAGRMVRTALEVAANEIAVELWSQWVESDAEREVCRAEWMEDR
jgi:hypothetical protein